jgi:hypothetical protein
MNFDPRVIEPSQKSGEFYEATKFEVEKDGAFNDFGIPKQHDYLPRERYCQT